MNTISFNGKIINAEVVNIGLLSRGMMYGYGLFETIKYLNHTPEHFSLHMKRFKEGAKILGLDLKWKEDEIKDFCLELIKGKSKSNGVLKIMLIESERGEELIISTRDIPYREEHYLQGFALKISNSRRNEYSKLVKVKSNNYLENLIELKKAKQDGYSEVLFLNTKNKLAEGSYTNIFFVKNGCLMTPDLESGILNGVMRGYVMEAAKKIGIEVKEGVFDKENILNSDEVFVTNSVLGIMPVHKIENVSYKVIGNITKKIANEINLIN